MSGEQYVWLNANSSRARARLPKSAECFKAWSNNGSILDSRYVYRVPAADFDPGILGGGHRGNITRARVIEANTYKCWTNP